ncbi:hypothetical protein C8J57DRAFT_1421401 [Mycena rebaudengoi]|nr:hypothetical protein C8J57DRAFT_1421401 [Mycena rebaudengoi]
MPSNITLHDLENALSRLVADMFWTLCHNTPAPIYDFNGNPVNKTSGTELVYHPVPIYTTAPVLLQGQATVTEVYQLGRLNVLESLPAWRRPAASLMLSLVSLLFIDLRGPATREGELEVDGTGVLHTIWLYRDHPELDTRLEQVEHPTDENLREAGMVRTSFVVGGLRPQGKLDR